MSGPAVNTITINNLIPKASVPVKGFVWLADRILGIAKMNTLYQKHNMQGLSKEAFADKLIEILELDIKGIQDLQAKIPKHGPLVIASNHPFGGIEGVILARIIGQVRPDLKVLANKGLGIFKELQDYFIFTNPLSEKDPQNGPSLRKCIKHVENQGALLLFPAGRVSYYQASKGRISEHTWNKIVGRLLNIKNCQYLPVFVNGTNSKWFYRLGRVYYRIRMLMLARELLNKTGSLVSLSAGNAIEQKRIKGEHYQAKTDFCRALSYAQDKHWHYTWPDDTQRSMANIQTETLSSIIAEELAQLPDNQRLIESGDYCVYFAYQHQAPNVINEIARLREIVFREHNEGSGAALDTDHFDASYTHLFIVAKRSSKIMGAYRMGRSDVLIKKDGLKGLYLNKMFEFSPNFVNRKEACLEMGRSFLIPEFQGSYQGLLLLWRGIGAFVCQFPQYRTLYGTVSISKLYHPKSVKLIEQILIKQENRMHVKPRNTFDFKLHPEIQALQQEQDLSENLSAMLSSIEHDAKDIPVLAKQYLKMGAKFHALGIDTSFNHTPGLLLSVHMPSAPTRLLKTYLGDAYQQYVDHST